MLESYIWSFLLALQFLTRLPITFIPQAVYAEPSIRRGSLMFFPVVGALVGLVAGGAAMGASLLKLPALACGVVAVATSALMTGAFHEDGLADLFDGFGAHTRERALEIMRDSRVGTFGTVALWVVLSLKAVAVSSMAPQMIVGNLVAAHMFSRWSALPLLMTLRSARSEGGLASSAIASALSMPQAITASVFVAAVCWILLGYMALTVFAVATGLVVVLTGLLYMFRFGGTTGDCLGATNQIVETVLLLAACTGITVT